MTKWFAHDTGLDALADGAVTFDFNTPADTGLVVSSSRNGDTWEDKLGWLEEVGGAGVDGDYEVEVDISVIDANYEMQFRLEARNSADAVQATSVYDGPHRTTGVKTATLSLSHTWIAGDRLVLMSQLQRWQNHGAGTWTADLPTTHLIEPGTVFEPQIPGVDVGIGPQSPDLTPTAVVQF